jgi:glycerol-3-phosphate dehydrogenase (NAD(P)+)
MDEGERSAPPRTDEVISEERFQRYHLYARAHGVNPFLYLLVRGVLQLGFHVWLRFSRIGREHLRGIRGGLVIASNHRSFLDPFVIGCTLPWRRPMQYVAKVELFEPRWQGWLLSRLGAFPIRRGQSDEAAMETARLVLDRGGTIGIFPEGTRIRSGSLSTPKRGVGRLALESGAAVVPVAVHGTERVRRGWRIRPRKVRLRVGRPMTFPRTENPSPGLAATVTARIWPNIELQWEWLGGLPPLRKAAVVGAGSWGTALAVLLARGGLEVQLGTRSHEKAEEIARRRENSRYLPGVTLPEPIAVKRASDIELGGVDLVCLAVPSAALPATVGGLGDRIGSRAAVLLLTKGLTSPLGQLPSEYVGERVRFRAIASLGGPAHAREAAAGMAALVLGTTDADLRAQLGEVFDRAGLVCERSDDVIGVEMAGVAKNAAALAAAAAEPHGMNAAGIAAATVWRECVDYARAQGALLQTFTGLAGVGDLTATVLAPASRNRRAGQLLGEGMPAEQIPAKIGQASEGLDSVPLLAEALSRAGFDAPGLLGLAALIDGSIDPGEWVAGLRRAERARRAA